MFCAKDFYRTPKYNTETKDQLWMSILSDSHELYCGCDTPFAHLLSNIFPIGHQDRNKTINQILLRDFKQLQRCHSGGGEEERTGFPVASTSGTTREEITAAGEDSQEDLEKLFAEREDAADAR